MNHIKQTNSYSITKQGQWYDKDKERMPPSPQKQKETNNVEIDTVLHPRRVCNITIIHWKVQTETVQFHKAGQMRVMNSQLTCC